MTGLLSKGVGYITGAGSGIGQYTAYAFAANGVRKLAITDFNPTNLQATVDELKKRHRDIEVLPIEMNCAVEADVDRSVKETVDRFGRIDFAVNNAGIGGAPKPTTEMPLSEWQKVMDVNVNGVWMCQRAQLRVMLKQEPISERQGRGSIVNVSSMLGTVGASIKAPAVAYAASKHAVMGLTKTDGTLNAPFGVRINALCPGYVATPLLHSHTDNEFMRPELEKIPLGRLGMMEEIADAAVFLSSPMASFMVASGLVVDGGYTAT
ncbi:oxidoreductase [Aulographum hederae CBS 113979]|uniref:Oxidoreductase n=1 Tax=Aulographum hederae CBS 113979 TaxID=1176131 RepID=A0A6G1HC82_9PEZI|nr:oxidoreductase [Aulographum hederae CBS 113979]